MSDQGTAATPAKKSGNPAVTWTIRIVVFGVLAALLVVAFLQWKVKRDFEATQSALNQKEDGAKGPLTLDDAEGAMTGSYEASDMKDDKAKGAERVSKLYTWSGPLSAYRLKITYSPKSKVIFGWTAKAEDIDAD
jgi:hypothetical protein